MNTTNRHRPRRTSDKAVRRATGRGRNEWFALLDLWGAAHKHRDIAAWIMQEHNVGNWWAQRLTVDYEQARGLRAPRGNRKRNVRSHRECDRWSILQAAV
jgi:hypothetical protein